MEYILGCVTQESQLLKEGVNSNSDSGKFGKRVDSGISHSRSCTQLYNTHNQNKRA